MNMELKTALLRDVCSLVSVLVLTLGILSSPPARGADGTGSSWGLQGDIGGIFLPDSLFTAFQDRYKGKAKGPAYAVGLAHFNDNGSPSFALQFYRAQISGDASGQGYSFDGESTPYGFLAVKYLNLLSRDSGSFGFGVGGGLGPQFEVTYRQTGGPVPLTSESRYRFEDLSITPFLVVMLQGDIRIGRRFSFGPYGGFHGMGPAAGVSLRVRFQ